MTQERISPGRREVDTGCPPLHTWGPVFGKRDIVSTHAREHTVTFLWSPPGIPFLWAQFLFVLKEAVTELRAEPFCDCTSVVLSQMLYNGCWNKGKYWHAFSCFFYLHFCSLCHTGWKYWLDSLGLEEIIQCLKSTHMIYLALAYSSCADCTSSTHYGHGVPSDGHPTALTPSIRLPGTQSDKVVKVRSQPLLNRDHQGSSTPAASMIHLVGTRVPWLQSHPSAPSQIFAIAAGRSHLTSQWRQLGSSLLADKTS